jgi:hypothetical protein
VTKPIDFARPTHSHFALNVACAAFCVACALPPS